MLNWFESIMLILELDFSMFGSSLGIMSILQIEVPGGLGNQLGGAMHS